MRLQINDPYNMIFYAGLYEITKNGYYKIRATFKDKRLEAKQFSNIDEGFNNGFIVYYSDYPVIYAKIGITINENEDDYIVEGVNIDKDSIIIIFANIENSLNVINQYYGE